MVRGWRGARPKVAAYAETAAALKRGRKALGESQASLGKVLGVTGLTVSRWETTRAEVPPSARRLVVERLVMAKSAVTADVAKAFGLTVPRLQADPAVRRADLELAILRTADALDMVPSLVRKAAAELFARLDALEMSPKEALRLVGTKP